MSKKVIIIAVAAVALVAVLVAVLVFGGGRLSFKGGSEKTEPIEKALEAIINCDGEGYYAAFPPEVKTTYEQLHIISDKFPGNTTMANVLDKVIGSVNNANYGEGYSLKAKVTEEKKLSVEELDKRADDPNLDTETFLRFVTEENTDEVWRIDLELNYDGDDGAETKEVSVYVVKQNGTWYLHPFFIFYAF